MGERMPDQESEKNACAERYGRRGPENQAGRHDDEGDDPDIMPRRSRWGL